MVGTQDFQSRYENLVFGVLDIDVHNIHVYASRYVDKTDGAAFSPFIMSQRTDLGVASLRLFGWVVNLLRMGEGKSTG